ncbi:MAG: 50S ribosomal protein L13 [Spirochaetaceae bacterium]|jgi:large subunit ribosomal protein L13|nr:50S ribosomal protein L13 [Spirochaetaceae bacterium]
MKTIFVNPDRAVRKWFLIDAEGKALGRIAARAAAIVRGKEKAIFAPHHELGDYLVLINAAKVTVSGRKYEKKLYHHHSGFPGGLKTQTYRKLAERHPTAPLEAAIRGMLPKGPLGRKVFNNVKIYAGSEHPHAAQNPEKIDF